MVLHMTRRNLLLLLFVLSVVGLLVYSRISSRVNLIRGTALSSGIRRIDSILHKDQVSWLQEGESWKRKGAGILPEDAEEGRDDDIIGVIRFPHESVNEVEDDEDDDDEDDDDDEGIIDDDSFVHDGTEGSTKGKTMVLIGNHMQVGGNLDKLMQEEGFIRGGNAARNGKVKGHTEKKKHNKEGAVVFRKNIPIKTSGRKKSTSNDTDIALRGGGLNTQVMVINERSPSKAGKVSNQQVLKVGLSPENPGEQRQNGTNGSVVVATADRASTHYFYEHPEDTKAKKIFVKCLSKMAPMEKKAFIEFEKNYQQRESLSRDGRLTLGGKWVILSEFMHSLDRQQRLPQVINIGAKKSGTTALGWFLTMHPQISHSFGNEVHFFDKNYHKGLEHYRSRMNFAKQNQVVFEKTPRYLVTDSAPGHALKDLPSNVKFIICIRDPLKRALSDFRHDSTLHIRGVYKRNPNVIKERTPETEGERFAAGAFDRFGNVNSSFDSVRTSSYVKHFRNWLSFFPRDRFIIVDHQQLVDDAFHELHRVETFLELTPFFEEKMFYYDQRRQGTCMRRPSNPCPPRSSPGFLPAGLLTSAEERKLRDYFRPLNMEFAELVGSNNFTWVNL